MKRLLPLSLASVVLVGLLSFQGCGGSHMPLPDDASSLRQGALNTSATATRAEVTYQDVQPIFKRACANCHAPGGALPNWLDYSVALKLKDRIQTRVVTQKTMPLGSALPSSDVELIAKWIKLGAIEKNVEPVETPTPVPSPVAPETPTLVRCEDAAPQYQGEIPQLSGEYRDQLKRGHAAYIKNGCNSCHGTTGRGDGPVAVAFDPKPRNFFTEDLKKGSTPAEIFGTVTVGFCSMPGFAETVSATERMEIATFLAGVRQNDGDAKALFTDPPPAPPAKKTGTKAVKKKGSNTK